MGQYTFVTTAPPTVSAAAAARWSRLPRPGPPWLHEVVGRRMAGRLEWITLQPKTWVDWNPLLGGTAAHAEVARRYPDSECFVPLQRSSAGKFAINSVAPWWKKALGMAPKVRYGMPPAGSAQMIWANMGLHAEADPQAVMAQWHALLEPGGFLMFSCLGPDTLMELRRGYQVQGWPPPAQAFTDMHDWGDMLVAAGFAEPVMDMERIALGYATPARLLQDLRELGRNLHPGRFPGLRGRGWRCRLDQALAEGLADPTDEGRLKLTFEIVYGHALKPVPGVRLEGESAVPLDAMRAMLRRRRV